MHDRAMSHVSTLDPAALDFLSSAPTATLGTIAPSGLPRLVPICFVVASAWANDAIRIYSPIDDKPKASGDPLRLARVRDIVERPRATLLVDRWSEDWGRLFWIRMDVVASIVGPGGPDGREHDAAVGALRAKYPQYEAHRLEERPLLRFVVERVVTWGHLD
jgi:PPOX class probable F420-dependent enzyme